MSEKGPQARFDAANRVKNFLEDEAVAEALGLLDRQYYEEFRESKTPETRLEAWAKAKVLADFAVRMRSIMEDGERARREILAEDKRTSAPSSK